MLDVSEAVEYVVFPQIDLSSVVLSPSLSLLHSRMLISTHQRSSTGTHKGGYYECKFYSQDKEAQKRNQEQDQGLADLKRLQEYENRIAPLVSASSGPASKSLLKTKKELQKKFETYCGFTEKQTQFLDEAAITVMQMKRMLKYCNIYLYFRPNSAEDKERVLFEEQMMQMTFTCDALHVLVDPDEKNNAHEYVSFVLENLCDHSLTSIV